MQEPQYAVHALWTLMVRIAEARVPCLSIMNMPPLPYLRRIPGLDAAKLDSSYTNAHVWDRFDPRLVTLCSPDPQAFRPPEEQANVLHVGLPTNFKAATLADPAHDALLRGLEAAVAAVRMEGPEGLCDVQVKLRVHDSLFVPPAKWLMLMTGHHRCITPADHQPNLLAVPPD